jgi:anti-sigma factor RsiW
MNCDTAIELLPWLLNGTLATEERDEVWHHLKTCESCRRSLAETRETWSVFAQHLPSQNLVALAWGEAPSEAVEEHLASCARCAAELELARMSRRLEEEENIALFPAAKPRPSVSPAVSPWSRRFAAAAGLAAVVAASGWLFEARQANDLSNRLAQAQSQAAPAAGQEGETSLKTQVAALVDRLGRLQDLQKETEKKAADTQAQVAQLEKERELLAGPHAGAMLDLGSGDVVRAGEAPGEKTLHGSQYVTLFLPARDGEAGRAEILDRDGKVVWRASQLPVTQGFYSLVLPPGSLPPGHYTLRLSGREERWPFQVVP